MHDIEQSLIDCLFMQPGAASISGQFVDLNEKNLAADIASCSGHCQMGSCMAVDTDISAK